MDNFHKFCNIDNKGLRSGYGLSGSGGRLALLCYIYIYKGAGTTSANIDQLRLTK